MNPLLSNQNLFVLTTINPKERDKPKLMVINEFDGFFDYIENEMAINIFGPPENSKKERIQFARNLLIKMIGKEEFLKLREFFQQSTKLVEKSNSFLNLNDSERIIFKLIAKGFKQTEIAQLLDWTSSKVKLHQNQIFEKMNFEKKADLLEFASKNRLI
jgi:DNA-binding CsgD family transcriptional regulator